MTRENTGHDSSGAIRRLANRLGERQNFGMLVRICKAGKFVGVEI